MNSSVDLNHIFTPSQSTFRLFRSDLNECEALSSTCRVREGGGRGIGELGQEKTAEHKKLIGSKPPRDVQREGGGGQMSL